MAAEYQEGVIVILHQSKMAAEYQEGVIAILHKSKMAVEYEGIIPSHTALLCSHASHSLST